MTVETAPVNDVRTFKMRKGRLGATQRDALDRLWPAYGVDVDGAPLDLSALFGRAAPVVLEIGCGMGEATVALAAAERHRDVLAVDVHTPGLGTLLHAVERNALTNVRVAEGDAVVVLRDMLTAGSLDEVRVLFPDPWPKARHTKRRLVQPAFVALVADRLRRGGRLHVATDSASYAAQVVDVLDRSAHLAGAPVLRPVRPVTRFEQRARDAGRSVTDIVAVRH